MIIVMILLSNNLPQNEDVQIFKTTCLKTSENYAPMTK